MTLKLRLRRLGEGVQDLSELLVFLNQELNKRFSHLCKVLNFEFRVLLDCLRRVVASVKGIKDEEGPFGVSQKGLLALFTMTAVLDNLLGSVEAFEAIVSRNVDNVCLSAVVEEVLGKEADQDL